MDDITSRETVKQFKWVGTRPVRPDGVPKVTGRALYGSDLAMPGMLVGGILRSPHAHARIRSAIPPRAASPGVKAVATSAYLPEQKVEYVGPERVAQNWRYRHLLRRTWSAALRLNDVSRHYTNLRTADNPANSVSEETAEVSSLTHPRCCDADRPADRRYARAPCNRVAL